MARLRGEIGVEGNEVGLAEQILQVAVLRSEFLLDLGGRPVHVVVQHAHGEPAGAAGQGLPDPAEAHDAEGRVVDVLAPIISGPQIHGTPERRKRSPSAIRRAAAIISANAASAVVSVSTSGVLQASTPCLVQASTSMLSKPTAKFATTAGTPRRPGTPRQPGR